jgi:hypothetical protein
LKKIIAESNYEINAEKLEKTNLGKREINEFLNKIETIKLIEKE